MPEPKLPTLSGEMRELRDGDRLELNGGWITPPGAYCCRRTSYGIPGQFDFFEWDLFGVYTKSNRPELNIKTILGPSEETHGDGTVTRVCTLPVTMSVGRWERNEPIAWRKAAQGEILLDDDGYCTEVGNVCEYFGLILRPKPAPTPTYTERLIEAVKAGECQLPYYADTLEFRKGTPVWLIGSAECVHSAELFGRLPKHLTESDVGPHDLQPIRDALKEKA